MLQDTIELFRDAAAKNGDVVFDRHDSASIFKSFGKKPTKQGLMDKMLYRMEQAECHHQSKTLKSE